MTAQLATSVPSTFPSVVPGKPHVFLAEDDPDLRRMLASGLADAGFSVVSAGDGRALLRLLTAASRGEVPLPDALVMDIRMPHCSGLDVLGALRLADWRQPVVMITGFGDAHVHETAAQYGASVIVDKPATADLIKGQTDEADLGVSYPRGDRILHFLLSGYAPEALVAAGFTQAEVDAVRRRLESTHWKRRLPTVAMVSQTAIGEWYLRPVDY